MMQEVFDLIGTCDRVRTFVRPYDAALPEAAGRDGDQRIGSKSDTMSSHGLLWRSWRIDAGKLGGKDALNQWKDEHYPGEGSIDLGMTDFGNKIIYISSQSGETVLHEMFHAVLGATCGAHQPDRHHASCKRRGSAGPHLSHQWLCHTPMTAIRFQERRCPSQVRAAALDHVCPAF